MADILQSFAGGIAFAVGAFVGIGIAAFTVRKREADMAERFHLMNTQVRDRLTQQVAALNRIADALDKRVR